MVCCKCSLESNHGFLGFPGEKDDMFGPSMMMTSTVWDFHMPGSSYEFYIFMAMISDGRDKMAIPFWIRGTCWDPKKSAFSLWIRGEFLQAVNEVGASSWGEEPKILRGIWPRTMGMTILRWGFNMLQSSISFEKSGSVGFVSNIN